MLLGLPNPWMVISSTRTLRPPARCWEGLRGSPPSPAAHVSPSSVSRLGVSQPRIDSKLQMLVKCYK